MMAVDDGERDDCENKAANIDHEISSSQDQKPKLLSSEEDNVKDANNNNNNNKEISETKKVEANEEKKNITNIVVNHEKDEKISDDDGSCNINNDKEKNATENSLTIFDDGNIHDKETEKTKEPSLPLLSVDDGKGSKEKEDDADHVEEEEENRNENDKVAAKYSSSSPISSDSLRINQQQQEEEEENISLGSCDDLKEHEKKGLAELRSLLEVSILANKLLLFKPLLDHHLPSAVNNKDHKNEEESTSTKEENSNEQEETHDDDDEEESANISRNIIISEQDDSQNDQKNLTTEKGKESSKEEEIDNKDISLWGVPLLPSKGDERTNVLLFKFLTACDFDACGAFEMLKNTLQWRKDNNMDSILDEDLIGNDDDYNYECLSHMTGSDSQGNPVCYNIYGVFADDNLYNKTFGTEASRERFLRWRLQLMEKQIQKLDFRPVGGTASLVQINDLDNAPGPSRREIRVATKRAVGILQENYPEFVANNIFINVPFWYYAFNAILSPFLTQRTKSKFVFSRPARVTETLLKYIAVEEIPVKYGGLRRENDPDFSTQDTAHEVTIKAGATETIEIPTPEDQVGNTLIWDLIIVGWDVSYKEEFVPDDEGSYTLIVKKGKKIVWEHKSFRNTFRNNEPGKIVITIENGMFKKKRVFYRYKTKKVEQHDPISA